MGQTNRMKGQSPKPFMGGGKNKNKSACAISPVALSKSRRKDLLSVSSTQTTFWVMFSEVEPTRPTARKM